MSNVNANAGSSRLVPRPLQLQLSSSCSSSNSRSSSPPVIAKSPLVGVGSAASSSVRYYNNTNTNNGSGGRDSPTVASPRIGGIKRQSSLSYNTNTNTNAGSTPHPQLQLHNHIRRNTVGGIGGGGGSKSNVGGNGNDHGVSPKSPSTTQLKDGTPSRSRSLLQPVRETEPATLAEKHADLLRFIAQKESKCLELRTQLAQHEAELLLLKQKWERIVSKGSPALPGSTSTSTGSAESSASTMTTRGHGSTSSTDVLLGIREGVQNGFEKVMAVLEPAIAGSSNSSSSSASSSDSSASASASSAASSSSGSPVSTTTSTPLPSKHQQHRPSPSTPVLKHVKNAESLSSTQGRSSISSSISSIFDDTQSTGTPRSLDSPVLEDGGYMAQTQKLKSKPSSSPPKNRPTSLSSTLSSLASPDSIGKHVATWVSPSLNKKWEELRNNETLSKQSKRASLLFNDMLSALSASSPISTTPSPSPSLASASHSQWQSPRAKHPTTDYLSTPISPLVLDPVVGTFMSPGTFSSLSLSSSSASVSASASGSASASASLLEDDCEENPKSGMGVVLQPDDRNRSATVAVPTTKVNTNAVNRVPDNTMTIKRTILEERARDASVAVDDSDDDDDDDDTQEKWNW